MVVELTLSDQEIGSSHPLASTALSPLSIDLFRQQLRALQRAAFDLSINGCSSFGGEYETKPLFPRLNSIRRERL
jgi:hypothetical protein